MRFERSSKDTNANGAIKTERNLKCAENGVLQQLYQSLACISATKPICRPLSQRAGPSTELHPKAHYSNHIKYKQAQLLTA